MKLYGFDIGGNCFDSVSQFEENSSRNHADINYYIVPALNQYYKNDELIQHFYLPQKTIIYNKTGQLLEITNRSIDFYSRVQLEQSELEYILLISAFPYLLRANSKMVLHGTALSYRGEAIILLGESGSWKSSLAYAMACQLGESIIADDLIVLSDDLQYVYKGIPKVRLFEKNYNTIRELFGGEGKKQELCVSYSSDKISLQYEDKDFRDSYKIRKVYILDNTCLDKESFNGTKMLIDKNCNFFAQLFMNLKCWQSICKNNISAQVKDVHRFSEKSFLRSARFCTVKNEVIVNIEEVVYKLIEDAEEE